ncbi:MAG: transposase [Desulfobacter sp.]|nr:transposase [Desulfobacter sp.]
MASHLQEIYGLEISNATLSTITDKSSIPSKNGRPGRWKMCTQSYGLMPPIIKYEKTERSAAKPFTHNSWGEYRGPQEVLGLYISENEGANFWLQVLTDLSNRG